MTVLRTKREQAGKGGDDRPTARLADCWRSLEKRLCFRGARRLAHPWRQAPIGKTRFILLMRSV